MVRRFLHVLIAFAAASVVAPPAHAEIALQVGMTLQGEGEACTAGFFGQNYAGRQYIVTAGHCSRQVGEVVYDRSGDAVGEVVARAPDGPSPLGPFGYTLIWIAQGTYIGGRFFNAAESANVGDTVHVYGARTGITNGNITACTANPETPAGSVLESSAPVVRGDSGGPWYEDGPTLVGISIGYDVAVPGGGFMFSYAMPVDPLVQLIQQTAGDWGNSFQVLTN